MKRAKLTGGALNQILFDIQLALDSDGTGPDDILGQMQLALTAIGPTAMIDLSADGPAVTGLLGFTRQLSNELGYREDVTADA